MNVFLAWRHFLWGMGVMEYRPAISQGYYPEDAGWIEQSDGEDILLLCMPEYRYLITLEVKSYEYAWLFNKELDAYIFCFKINKQFEQAVIFKQEHAGILLKEEFANKPFTIAITDKQFTDLKENDPVFMLQKIELKKHENAGW